MWKTICTTSEPYLFDYQRKGEIFIFYLTNLNSFWMKEIPEELLLTKFQVRIN